MGTELVNTIFVHMEQVRITCPLCGAVMVRVFQRLEPSDGFVPALVTCICGRYAYGHSQR
jgi:hypothetical protein